VGATVTRTLVGSNPAADQFLEWYERDHEWLAVDTETSGKNPWHDRLRLVQFGDEEDGWAIPFEWEHGAHIVALALDMDKLLCAFNAKFDRQFLFNNGMNVEGIQDDVGQMVKLASPMQDKNGLTNASVRILGDTTAVDDEVILKMFMLKNHVNYGTIDVNQFEYWWYGCGDTIRTARLAASLFPRVQASYVELYEMETTVWQALADAEQRGMVVDEEYCREESALLREAQDEIQAPYPFPLGGKKELVPALKDRGVGVATTAKGNDSITDDVLTPFKGDMLVDDVLEYRGFDKLAGTYFEPFVRLAVDGRIHTTINALGARTGRMSSAMPNLQNVPKRDTGDYVRRAFIPSPGNVFVFADYAQIEYRLFASACAEPAMIQAFLDGKDMHRVTAEMAFGREVDEDERDMAKNGNFAELYMAGLAKFAKTAGITMEMAKDFRTKYHRQFTRVKPFTRSVMRYAKANGFMVETKFGRIVPVDEWAIWAAINYLIQGTAADILKRAIAVISGTRWIEYFVLPIHDELGFDVPKALAPALVADLPELMEDRTTFDVPITVDIKVQSRWGEALQEAA